MAQTQPPTYEIHLRPAIAEELGIDSTIETDRIDYYDSGFWVTRPEGREFFPYDHVLSIRERTGSTAEEASPEGAAVEPTDVED